MKGNAELEKVRELEASRIAIAAHFNGLIAELGGIVHESEDATQSFFTTFSRDDMLKALESRSRRTSAEELSYILRKQTQGGELSGRFFRSANPNYRRVLSAAAEFRLKNTRAEFKRIIEAETKRLGGKNFDSAEIAESPEVKRARSEVETFERLVAKIQNDPEETVWQNATAFL